MKYVILEDEKLASNRLRSLVQELRPDYRYLLSIDSVESASISLPALNPDLLFMDIQLSDGLSFDIFDQIKLDIPIIFTTAYDEYAIKAFKSNSVDYLLKPIDPEELKTAIEKFEKQNKSEIPELSDLVKSLQPTGKERFIVKVGEHLKTVNTTDINLVFSQDKGTYLFTNDKRRFLVDYSLDKVEELVDPSNFFRISRKFIVSLSGIKDMISFANSRLKIIVDGFEDEPVIVARERVSDFKNWLDR